MRIPHGCLEVNLTIFGIGYLTCYIFPYIKARENAFLRIEIVFEDSKLILITHALKETIDLKLFIRQYRLDSQLIF